MHALTGGEASDAANGFGATGEGLGSESAQNQPILDIEGDVDARQTVPWRFPATAWVLATIMEGRAVAKPEKFGRMT